MPPPAEPLRLAEQRLAWLEARQQVLARNIANADTPQFRPRDLAPFHRLLAGAGGLGLARSSPLHLAGASGPGPRATTDRLTAERTPNGNAVALDEQALKVADTDSAHALATALHRRYLGLFRTALGRS